MGSDFMGSDFMEHWLGRSQALASRYGDGADMDLPAEVASLVGEARTKAEQSGEGATSLERISGQLRGALPTRDADDERPSDEAAVRQARRIEALSALALQFSRVAGEVAGSPT